MMFSTKAEYGVRVMVALAQRAAQSPDGEEPVVPLAEIAERDGLPLAYLEHLVARLRKAELIDSRRGSRGGYMLARAPAQITMAEVVEALEGSIAPIECISQGPDGSIVCARESSGEAGGAGGISYVCPTKLLWTRVRSSIVRTLLDTTLADLLAGTASDAGTARTAPGNARELPLAPTAAVQQTAEPTAEATAAARAAKERRAPDQPTATTA
jgi:Rrf2 family transcriptional regulator, cysteine metabolism repressor